MFTKSNLIYHMSSKSPYHEEGGIDIDNEEEIIDVYNAVGFDPMVQQDPPNYKYPLHDDPGTRVLAILDGEMSLQIGGKKYRLKAGDYFIIPAETEHSAVCGSKGCRFLWAEDE